MLTTVDVDEQWRGQLIVVQGDDLAELVVDDHVPLVATGVDEDDTLVYGVSDEERTGVWLARLAP